MPRTTFDIFLSSTSADLQEYRTKVTEMIDRIRQTTIRMETFGAKPTKPPRHAEVRFKNVILSL